MLRQNSQTPALASSTNSTLWNQIKSITSDAYLEANTCLSPFNNKRFRSTFRFSDNFSSDSDTDLIPNSSLNNEPMDLKRSPEHLSQEEPMAPMTIQIKSALVELKSDAQTPLESATELSLKDSSGFQSCSTSLSPVVSEKPLQELNHLSVETSFEPDYELSERTFKYSLDSSENRRRFLQAENANKNIRRSSSLKPPNAYLNNSKSVKKAVRFANAFGLDLVDVKQIFNFDDPPIIPDYAFSDLHVDEPLSEPIFRDLPQPDRFQMLFIQPGSNLGFIDRVKLNAIALERVDIDPSGSIITGLIRVLNKSVHKAILVRMTFNNWTAFIDTPATYIENSHDGVMDQFSFRQYIPPTMKNGDKIQFALKYETPSGEQFWDSNFGLNYHILCKKP